MSYVYGYVDIEVEGYYIERFINICASKGIYLWKTKRNKSTILCARIKREDFKKLRAICKKTQCKMKIRNKKTNNIFNLPKVEVETLLEANPELYEKMTTTKTKKNACNIFPMYEQNTILPLIWEK